MRTLAIDQFAEAVAGVAEHALVEQPSDVEDRGGFLVDSVERCGLLAGHRLEAADHVAERFHRIARMRGQLALGALVGDPGGHAARAGDLFGQAVLDLDEFSFAHSCAFIGFSSMSMSD